MNYHEEGLSHHDGVTIDQVRSQLYRKLPEEETEKLIATLQHTGRAEIRKPRLTAKFSALPLGDLL